MYSYMLHAYLLQSQVILAQFWIAWLHFEMSYQQKDLTDYKH